jgi:hypothetical protein
MPKDLAVAGGCRQHDGRLLIPEVEALVAALRRKP